MTHANLNTDWETLFDGLDAAREALVGEIVDRVREELPAYRDVAREELLPGFGLQMDAVLRSARTGAAVSGSELDALAGIGEARALGGVPIEDMLRAWRIGIQVLTDHGSRIGAERPAATLDFVRAVLTWADVTMVATATAHRRAELELARQDSERRTALVRGLLFGTLPLAEARDELRAYGFDTAGTFVAVRARPSPGTTTRDLDAALGLLDATPYRAGLRITHDGDLAGFLREAPPADLPGAVGVGPPRPLDQLPDSFRLASRAFLCAQRFGLTGAHTVDDLGLLPSIADDRDVGEALIRRYLEPLGAGGSRAELVATLRAYFECAMNVDRTAERVFVHPNTVRYRINRFEELTGASLREPETAFETWWALRRSAMQPTKPDSEDPR